MVNFIIAILIIVAIIVFATLTYNKLVTFFNRTQNAFSQIDVQLKRRYDLIPNLVEVAKKYMQHEEDALRKVIEARNEAKSILDSIAKDSSNMNINRLSEAENTLESALGKLNITLEAYPELKANENMKQLSEELASTENKIAFARQAYNDSVMNYNTYKQSFPTNIIAAYFKRFQRDLPLLTFEEGREKLNETLKIKF
ncbi:MAG: LemA family protein [Helicobacteraceae bacterium]|nr:LemA family protein [Helicobacteraceae bacterium]